MHVVIIKNPHTKILIDRIMASSPHLPTFLKRGIKGSLEELEFCKSEDFEHYFERSRSGPFSSFYLLLMPDLSERKFLAQKMAHAINRDYVRVDADTILSEIESPTFFTKKERVLICEGIEAVQDHAIPLPPGLILIATSGEKSPPPLGTAKKSSVILNLTKEKPWERTTRLQRWLSERALSEGKVVEADALAYLLNLGHTNFLWLLQELEKAIVYSGKRERISIKMIQSTASPLLQTGWQLSEILVWGGNLNSHSINALENFHALVGQIRYQLNLGISLSSDEKAPKPLGKKGERLKALATRYSPSYFVVGLRELFALELRMRSNTGPNALLFEHFYTKLSTRRSRQL